MSVAKTPSKIFVVWHPLGENWNTYDTLQNAVAGSGSEIVYEAKLKRLGRFMVKTEIIPYTAKTLVDSVKRKTKRKYTKKSKFWGKK